MMGGGEQENGSGGGGMMDRGTTRPMSGQHGSEHGDASDREQMVARHHRRTLWVYWTLLLLGLWTLAAPLTFGYGGPIAQPPGGRELWLSDEARVSVMTWSDLLSGALLTFFAWRSLTPNRPVSLWMCCFVGIWLTFAPLVFWAPSAAAYLNATVVGALVIALSIIVPGMPNMVGYMKMGPDNPPGWSYNPSSWAQRSILIALAFVGWLVSRYLAAFQLGYIEHAWDPFFGEQSRRVLTSDMSHALPISDAGLGSAAYTFEFLMGLMGGTARWRTMPWMVTLFGVLVIPLGLVHIFLVISQPMVVGAWCTLCLLAAALMLPMIPLEGDEVVAMGQHLRAAKRRGESVWSVFWKGGSPEGSTADERSPSLQAFPKKAGRVVKASVWGMSVPWSLLASVGAGLALVFVPAVFGVERPAANAFQVGGLLVVTFSVIAMGEVFRPLRWVNVLLGAGVALLPWLLQGAGTGARLAGIVLGAALVAWALPRGPKRERYATWDRLVT